MLLRSSLRPLALLLAVLALAVAASPAWAKEQSARVNVSVGAGETHATRLGNLPQGAKLALRIESSGAVRVFLLDQRDFTAFPELDSPFFDGRTADRLRFSVKVPEPGDYYLVLDNRAGGVSREVTLAVTASTEPSEASGAAAEDRLERAHAELDEFVRNLRRVFVFDELDFRLGRCGTANAYSGEDTVYLCTEMAPRLMKAVGDKHKASDILLFAMLHEIGHVLLRQWDYPFYDSEEVADEFATVLMVMFGQAARARTQAEYLSGLSPEEEFERKRERDDRHPLSVQRARNILGWLDDPELVRRWQKLLVPHMQTSALRALAQSPKPWTDRDLVREELGARGGG